MAALTPTYPLGSQGIATEFGGDYKLYIFSITPTTATDTVTLVRASDKIVTAIAAWLQIQSGTTANFATAEVTFSGLVFTIKTYNASGVAATSWGPIWLFIVAK